MADWLETGYVCDRRGRRYIPCWKAQGRVRVDFGQLQRWYRTLDHLYLNKSDIEVALYHRLRDLFEFQPDLVLYDLTSTYFTGHGPPIAKHGYSRDGKPRRVQVAVVKHGLARNASSVVATASFVAEFVRIPRVCVALRTEILRFRLRFLPRGTSKSASEGRIGRGFC